MLARTEPVSLAGASHFHAICRKCTREKRFYAPTIAKAVEAAVQAGWVMSGFDFESGDKLKRFQYTCPKCPATARLRNVAKPTTEQWLNSAIELPAEAHPYKKLRDGRIVRTHCGSCGRPLCGEHDCPYCEEDESRKSRGLRPLPSAYRYPQRLPDEPWDVFSARRDSIIKSMEGAAK